MSQIYVIVLSVSDPYFFWADPDPSVLADQDPLDWAWNSDHFTFLKFKNPCIRSKVISIQSLSISMECIKFF